MRITSSCSPFSTSLVRASHLLGILFVFIHFMVMRTVFTHPQFLPPTHQPAPAISPAEIMGIFQWFYIAAALWMIASLVLNLLSGLYLRAGKHRTFSIVVAALNCIHMPLGTVLGVFTLIVLLRDSMRERYLLPN
jgi:hypothetical protein